ncbi:hypothetical protein ZEAMMB73_Zm00001d046283 [Zea mays]|uniref:Myb/SANT-like domain-containing protein n=1 Tax=Zea mays TaxID=4577 RepID=A0A1D6P200_MAIZE|nr:hypothetical protein ZEAMMB73_Zm00001d046283 [Zea mays]
MDIFDRGGGGAGALDRPLQCNKPRGPEPSGTTRTRPVQYPCIKSKAHLPAPLTFFSPLSPDIADPKWKREGGFKNGYCSVLENELKARLPGCGLSAIPHIESRVRHFRTKYGAIEVMLAKSGFIWDDNRKMVQCEKQQYEAHCKSEDFLDVVIGCQLTVHR